MTKDNSRAVIGADLLLHGTVRNAGMIEVLGRLVGSVAAEKIVIHPGGSVTGQLDVGAADVNGHLEGRIRVRNLITIGPTGVVHGDVRYGRLAVMEGGDLLADVRNVPPEIGGDFEIAVRRGRSVRVTTADLMATDAEDGADRLTFHVSNTEHGSLAMAAAPGKSVESFTQADISAGRVLFVHDGGEGSSAGFDVVVADSQGATSGEPRRVSVVVLANG